MIEAKELIRCCRTQAGLSQRQLARMTGFNADQINRWENGINEPRFEFVMWILQAMGLGMKLCRLEDEDEQLD